VFGPKQVFIYINILLPMHHFCFQDFRSDRILDHAKKAQQGQIQITGGALYGSGAKNPTVRGVV